MTANKTFAHDVAAIAHADPETGEIEASAVFRTKPERLFRALTTEQICDWWVRPNVFDTREWTGDLRVGGQWQASGMGGGQPYKLEGTFVEIDAPRRLVHTWRAVGAPGGPATVIYDLAPHPLGVRLTLRHTGIMNPDVLEKTRAGWVTSFERLQEIVASEQSAASP
jgi:uncharacterized protein YndB with AHSA1/START domain